MKRGCNDIRNEFIAFFEQRGHRHTPSSSLLPAEDPTLLFTNAGMNQFKSIFLGTETPGHTRAVNSQKCIRAGGKHNDLEDVGHDTYHHTFFEMLGNWSFGDYFKAEAIQWAWELLTDVWGLPKERLHVTVFEGDEADGLAPDTEAETLWRELTDVDPSHIHKGNKKDNFWEMGDTGPCGPCSEIHIDQTDDLSGHALVNKDDPRVIELWNLVFIQFNRGSDGSLTPLPAQHVDTGMGLERIVRVLQGQTTNYATDLFIPIFEKIETLTDHRYGAHTGLDNRFASPDLEDPGDIAFRVIADHARALTFAIADGILPSNDGRGYVLRRILRRACRYGRQYLGIEGCFLTDLVGTIVELMGGSYPELGERQDYVREIIRDEEESFGKTLDRGIALFDRKAGELAAAGSKTLDGEVAFDLYATYGFPVDLTQIMASERGLDVDLAGYEAAMEAHRAASSGEGGFKAEEIPPLPATDDEPKYHTDPIDAKVVGWVAGGKFITDGAIPAGQEAIVVLDRTNFYGETGGQVGDTGVLMHDGGTFVVRDTQLAGDSVLHFGQVEGGPLPAGQAVRCLVDPQRMDIRRNHSATHLLNWALRKVLGGDVNQAGSVVAPDRLRFDFTHGQAVSAEQLAEVEALVNGRILADLPVVTNTMPLAEAKKIPGVRAVFGEKYPDPVRVIVMGVDDPMQADPEFCSVEFCGGTHLDRTSQVGLFKIVSEESVAKGVRRITALTGRGAYDWVADADQTLRSIGQVLRVPASEAAGRIEAMQQEIKKLRKRPAGGGGADLEIVASAEATIGKIIVGRVGDADPGAIRTLCDQQRQKGAAAVMIGSAGDEKVTLVAMVSDEAISQSGLKAGDWVKAVAPVVGGGGGGKPNLAQAGGKDPAKLGDALAAAIDWAKQKVS